MKLYVLTGFLGSGKTTLLKNLLTNEKDLKIGVIMNEFGKISIDGELVNRNGVMMTEINRGSIFCSCLKLNFVQTLSEMIKQDLDLVIVESSGLADPSNLGEILEAVTEISGQSYDYEGSICLIDAVDFLNQVDEIATVYRQTKHCQLAAVSKLELDSAASFEDISAKIREINPTCQITQVDHGHMDLDLLQTDLRQGRDLFVEDSTNTADTKPKTMSMTILETITKEELMNFLSEVSHDAYRIKGPVMTEEGLFEVDVVNDRIDLHDPTTDHPELHLVFISKVGPAIIRTVDNAWKTFVGKKMKLKN